MTNSRFADYATSGAFQLSLTRNQVSGLAMLGGGVTSAYSSLVAGLERKGLCEPIAAPTESHADAVEFRATHAGLLVMALTQEAGLTNGLPDPVFAELRDLHAEVAKARIEAREARLAGRSAMARQQEVEAELAATRADLELARTEIETGLRLRDRPQRPFTLRLRDPLPERSDAMLADALREPV